MKIPLLLAALMAVTSTMTAQLPELPLWPKGAPGSEGKTQAEVIVTNRNNGERRVYQVHNPSITPFLPEAAKASGTAVIVIPGGGHRELQYDPEGIFVARALADHGIAAFVLKYRLARETNSTYTVQEHAVADTQRAIRTVRAYAAKWNIDPDKIGAVGFSAGGELINVASLTFDEGKAGAEDEIERVSSKPNFQALIYPGGSSRVLPTTNSPPAFLACGYNDRPDISEGLAQVYLRFKAVKVPCELHIYSGAGHAFAYRPSSTAPANGWLMRFEEWLEASKLLTRK
jgi:endo-1,4-beta-xylanase